MNPDRSDALILFGATGDLAFKKIFPALYAMTIRDQLSMPVIGVARSGWTLERFRAHARRSIEQDEAVDDATFVKFAASLQYVEGDYSRPETYLALRAALGDAKRPLYYLAIPPDMFETVAQGLGASNWRIFWRIYVPLTLNGIFAGSVLVFVLSLGFFITPALLGGGRVIMIAVLIEQQVRETLNWPFAAALSAVLLAFTFAVYAVAQRFTRSEATT